MPVDSPFRQFSYDYDTWVCKRVPLAHMRAVGSSLPDHGDVHPYSARLLEEIFAMIVPPLLFDNSREDYCPMIPILSIEALLKILAIMTKAEGKLPCLFVSITLSLL